MRSCIIIPAYQAEATVGGVVAGVARALPGVAIFVVDDGSDDATAECARRAGSTVIAHGRNQGKGAALRTGLRRALRDGFDVAVTVDADGQHPAEEAALVLGGSDDPGALILGVRDLAAAGAPRKNQLSNGISNYFLSRFSARTLQDTQCGLRRYPVAATLALAGRAQGYAFEAEIILRALAAGLPLVEVPVRVYYPPEHLRVTHFDSVRDPARIIGAVLRTLADVHVLRRNAAAHVQRSAP
jgi:glycosyltransferase involved in cell wall biosynthesis